MGKGRLEAFSDGVLAIIITIMVLDLKVPPSGGWAELETLGPFFFSYVMSFIYVAIYWSNHHHLFQVVSRVNGPILWANTHLLFWLSLFPFATAWMDNQHFSALPVALYGFVLFMAAVAYYILAKCLVHEHGLDSTLGQAMGRDFKGKISAVFYALAIPLAGITPYIAVIIYVLVAFMWIVPDQRIERLLQKTPRS